MYLVKCFVGCICPHPLKYCTVAKHLEIEPPVPHGPPMCEIQFVYAILLRNFEITKSDYFFLLLHYYHTFISLIHIISTLIRP